MHVRMNAHVCVCVYMYTDQCMCVYVYTHECMRVYVYRMNEYEYHNVCRAKCCGFV